MIGTGCTLGRAPRTKETLPDFHEWCRVTRHPRIFHGLMGCQRTPGKWGVTENSSQNFFEHCLQSKESNKINGVKFRLRMSEN